MNKDKIHSPYSLSATFRAYAYDEVVLAWETQRVNIISAKFNKKTLEDGCGLYVLRLDKLSDVQRRDEGTWSSDEFLIFHNDGRGYECLFKRLRDTFAHGHYWQSKQDWITIRHRYKGSRDKLPNTRVFGNLRISTLKRMVAFLDTTNLAREVAR
ncbi:MAG: hypothetical protein Q7U78_04595 [Gallionella sp.]|nr:hypothetical protein [Gallionella sp.]